MGSRPARYLKKIAATTTVLVVVTAVLALVGPPTSAWSDPHDVDPVVINPGGGSAVSGTDGLRIMVNGPTNQDFNASDQLWYRGAPQTCCKGVTPMVNIGGTLYTEAGPANYDHGVAGWTDVELLATSGSTSTIGDDATGSGTATLLYTIERNELTYTMERHLGYTYPNDYVTDTYTFTIPEGNTEAVKFYYGGDTTPGGTDWGYGIMLTSPVRSVISLDKTGSHVLVGAREVPGTTPFDGAYSRKFDYGFNTAKNGGDIDFSVDTSNHDAGFMVQWNIGSTPGTHVRAMELFVNRQSTALTASFREPTLQVGDPGLLDLNVVNTQLDPVTDLGFTFSLPEGLTIRSTPPDNDCGGTLSATADASTITLVGGSVGATTNCVVSIPLVTADAGAYRIGQTSVTSITGMDNGVGSTTLTVEGEQAAPQWTDDTLAPPTLDEPYSDGVSASGYPAPTYEVTEGSLPGGLSLDQFTGAVTGTPSSAGDYDFTITASNGVGDDLVERFTGSVVVPSAPSWTDETMVRMLAGEPYEDSVTAAGSPAPTYSIVDGALPVGLTLDGSTGSVTGTPTDDAGAEYSFTIEASNGVDPSVTTTVSDTIGERPRWTDDTITAPVLGRPYDDGVSASGHPTPGYSITAGHLPDGLSLDPVTGSITGTATTAGAYDFTITADNGIGNGVSARFTGEVVDPAGPQLDPDDGAEVELDLQLQIGARVGSEGATVLISGRNVRPGSQYTVTMHSEPRVILTEQVGSDGTFVQRIVIPGDTPPGAHSLVLRAVDTAGHEVTDTGYFKVSSDLRIEAFSADTPFDDDPDTSPGRYSGPGGVPPTRGQGRLAYTGASIAPVLVLGILSLLVGWLMVGVTALERQRSVSTTGAE